MPACIFIFNLRRIKPWEFLLVFATVILMGFSVTAWGQSSPANAGGNSSSGASQNGAASADEKSANTEDIVADSFTEYGEFDSGEDEANDEKFFQYGRFFGIGLGLGHTLATGNAGRIYQGGFPTVDFKLDYWFDFHFALQLAVQNSKHNYNIKPDGPSDVNLFRILFQVKYYFDTRDLAAPITFIGPHLIAGGGFYQRTDNIGSGAATSVGSVVQSQNAFGFLFGAGLEITLKPKKTYLQIESQMHLLQFGDQNDPKFDVTAKIPNRSGYWISNTIGIMWTW